MKSTDFKVTKAGEGEATREETILEKAERIVMKDREEMYGHPKDNHRCTAALWTGYLDRRAQVLSVTERYDITLEDVCFLNILQKVSRCANTITKDSLADIAGWARCIERIMDADLPGSDDQNKHTFSTGIDGGTICERCHQEFEHDIHIDRQGNRM